MGKAEGGGGTPDRNLLHKVTQRVNFKRKKGQMGRKKNDMLLKKHPPPAHTQCTPLLEAKKYV